MKHGLVILLVFISSLVWSQADEHHEISVGVQGCSGYVKFRNDIGEVKGAPNGAATRLHIFLGDKFRIGAIVGNVSVNYKKVNKLQSYFRLGYGGLSMEYCIPMDKMRLSAGITVGLGSIENIEFYNTKPFSEVNAFYQKYGTFISSPILAFEYFIGDHAAIITSVDYFTGTQFGIESTLGGPKFQLGLMYSY